MSFNYIIASVLLGSLTSFVLVYIFARKCLTFGINLNIKEWAKFLKESYPVGISSLIVFAYYKSDTIMLSIIRSSSDVGIYNAAYKILESISFFPAMMVGLILPLLSKYIFFQKENFEKVSNEMAKVFYIIIIPLIITVLFLAEGIIYLIGGSQFYQAANILRILAFAMAFIFYGTLFMNIMIAGEMQKKMLWVLGFCAIFNIGANLIFIPFYGYYGAAVISAVTEFLVAAGCGLVILFRLNYFPKIRSALRITLSGLVMAIFLFFLKEKNIFVAVIFSIIPYLLMLWVLKAVSTQDIKALISKAGVVEGEYEHIS